MARNRKTSRGKSRLRKTRKGFLFKLVLICGALFAIAGIVVLSIYGARSLQYDISTIDQMQQLTTVYDMDGNIYHRLHGENRVKVSIDKVSPYFVKALLAREDSRFYQHDGIDYLGIARAIFRNITHMEAKEGASTLTQQLARNSFTLGGKNLDRKLLEAVLAKRIEQKYSKKEILELYVNRIYFGRRLHGIETASLAYFGKPSADLTLGEAAMLAGIIRSPNRLAPSKNLTKAVAERDTVLERMFKLRMISQAEMEEAKRKPIKTTKEKFIAQETFFMDAIRRELDVLLSDIQVHDGGLNIYTTIDPDLQKTAEAALESHLAEIERRPGYKHPKKSAFVPDLNDPESKTPYLQGAVVVVDNRNGAIRALVGGRDYSHGQYNRALQGSRQVGSSFKPFVYSAAFARGMMPGMLVDDGPLRPGEITGATNWNPANSDGTFQGLLPAQAGLVRSRNTMTIRIGEWAGMDNVRKIASDAGLGTIPNQPVVYLGAFEQSLRDLTAAYTVFPNNGLRRQTYFIERIDDAEGNQIYRASHLEVQVLHPSVAWLTSSALRDVLRNGTAAAAKSLGFTKAAGGKTGTTNDYRDAWFLGFTSSLTCGVWVGLDKPETIMGRGYGSTLALPVWVKIMSKASSKHYPAGDFTPPEPIREATLCGFSNALATPGCQAAGTAYTAAVPQSMVPRTACDLHQGGRGLLGPADSDRRERRREDGFGRRLGRSLKRFFGGD